MKCCSRSTLGVVVGILNIVFFIGVSISVITIITDLKNNHDENIYEYRRREFIL